MEKIKGKIILTSQQLKNRIEEILNTCPEKLYKDSVVINDYYVLGRNNKGRGENYHFYRTTDKRPFTEVISEIILKRPNLNVKTEENCTYNSGKRDKLIEDLENLFKNEDKMKAYSAYYTKKGGSIYEPKLVHCLCHKHKNNKNLKAVDFQIPTKNSSFDKIDLLLQEGDNYYITEAKTFGSIENLLRCILEIETYYEKLNSNFYKKYNISPKNLKKAILIDKTSASYAQLSEPWAEKLLKKFDIKIFELTPNLEIV